MISYGGALSPPCVLHHCNHLKCHVFIIYNSWGKLAQDSCFFDEQHFIHLMTMPMCFKREKNVIRLLSLQWKEAFTIPLFRQTGLRYLTISIKTASTYWTPAYICNVFYDVFTASEWLWFIFYCGHYNNDIITLHRTRGLHTRSDYKSTTTGLLQCQQKRAGINGSEMCHERVKKIQLSRCYSC